MRGWTRSHGLLIAGLGIAACAKAGTSPDGGTGADAPPGADAAPADARIDAALVDAPTSMATWRDDTTTDFSAAGATATDVLVEDWGALGAAGRFTGGLVQRASDTGTFSTPATTTWAEVTALPPTGKIAVIRGLDAAWASDTPPSVGLTDGDAWTMWFEGEIYLDAGTTTLALLADDYAFVDVADAAGGFTRIAAATWPDEATGTVTVAAAGWYGIHAAVSEGAVDALIRLRAQPPAGALAPVPRHRLRARVDGLTGLVQYGFDDSRGVGDLETTIDAVTPGDTNWNTGNPGDLGMTAADTFSVRWAGQFRVDVAGAYTFRLTTDDGQRLWIDGAKLLDAWDDTTHDQVTGAVTLGAGWHDLVIDHTENGGGASASLRVESGPELTGQAWPVARLRPVEARSQRLEAGVDHADVALPDLATIDRPITLTAPPGAVVAGFDLEYELQHTYWGDLQITVIAPSGQAVIVRNRVGGASSGILTERMTRADLDGAAAGGTWTVRFADQAGADSGTIRDVELTVHTAGAGEPPFQTASTWDSPVRDLGATVVGIDQVRWGERAPAGFSDVQVRLRACDAPCTTEAWSAPLTDPAGSPAGITARRYAQYRVELTSTTGDVPAQLDWIEIDYRTSP